MAPVAFAIVLVECVEESRANEGTRPDHASRPDDELAKHAAKGEADNLRGQRKEDLVCV